MNETEFGTVLRRARISASLSQRELADAAGLSERAVNDIECGRRRRPYPATVRRLALALGLEGESFRVFAWAARPETARDFSPSLSDPEFHPDAGGGQPANNPGKARE